MDKRSWPWKKKSSDKTTLVLESVPADSSSHSQVEKETIKKPKYVQISIEQYTHLTSLEEQIKTYNVQINSYETQVETYEEQIKSFEEQIEKYDEEIQNYAEKVQRLNEDIEDLNDKLCVANEELVTKETSVKQHSKVAEDAVSGWEKADNEALTLKNTLESVTLSKLTAEDRATHLDGALKECMRQIRNLKKDHEVKLHEVTSTNTKQIETITMEFEKRISEFEQELLRSEADNDALSRTLQDRSNMLMKISEEKSKCEAEIEILKSNLEMCEREVKSLKYEVHVIGKELEIRNEEKNMCIRSSEVANKQHLEGVKKIGKLEGECQRLRSLVRKKLPGPAALAQMKFEVENLGGDSRIKRSSPVKASSPSKSLGEFSLDNSQKFQKENEFLTERLLAMEEETKMLKEALAKRNSELLESRNLCAQSISKVQSLETQLQQRNSLNASSSISVSEDGNDESGSSNGSLIKIASLERVESVSSHVDQLMDDFLEMEKLACEAHTELEDSSGVMAFKARLSKVLESVSTDTDLRKIVEDIKHILQDVNDCIIDQDKPSDVQEKAEEQKPQSVRQDITEAVSKILEFVSMLREEARASEEEEENNFVELVENFSSITSNNVSSLEDFVLDLANVLNKAMELKLKVNFTVLASSSSVEILSQDCIDKVVDKDSSKEYGYDESNPNSNSEIEEMKSEKEKILAEIDDLKLQLQESEKMFESAQRLSSLADTQLRCMTESYRSLETRAAELEIEVNQLKEKVRSLENELEDERSKHQEANLRCLELEEHIQKNIKSSLVVEDDEEDDIKTKQERELEAAAEKLAECQETISMLGKQLKSFRPQQSEQVRSTTTQQTQSESEELRIKNYTGDEGDSADTWVNEVPQFMESPKSDSDTSDLMGSKLWRSGSSGNPTPEKQSRGISRFFSSKSGY